MELVEGTMQVIPHKTNISEDGSTADGNEKKSHFRHFSLGYKVFSSPPLQNLALTKPISSESLKPYLTEDLTGKDNLNNYLQDDYFEYTEEEKSKLKNWERKQKLKKSWTFQLSVIVLLFLFFLSVLLITLYLMIPDEMSNFFNGNDESNSNSGFP